MSELIEIAGTVEAADSGKRTISGRIVTFGEPANARVNGIASKVIFEPGSIKPPADPGTVRFQREHERGIPLGRGVEFSEVLDDSGNVIGLDGTFRVIETQAGNDALVEAQAGLRDGLSVGVRIIKSEKRGNAVHVTAAELYEVSHVVDPAIDSARISSVAASQADEDEQAEAPADAPLPSTNEEPMSENTEATPVEASASVVTASIPSAGRSAARVPSLGEYIQAAATRVQEPEKFAHVTAALAEQVISENPGIVPEPVIGPIVDTLLASRPLVSALPVVQMPNSGKTYTRPKVTQHTNIGAQAAELDELVSRLMKIDPITVTKNTYGGALRLSVQDRDFTDPAILNLLVQDMIKMYAKQTDAKACADLVAAVTQTETLANGAAADVVIAAIYGAAEQVVAGVNELPDTIFASVDQWSRLGSLVDTTKRQIFPSLAPNNAAGTLNAGSFSGNPLNLNLVVDANLAPGTLIVGRSEYFEVHEQRGGQLSVDVPSILATDLAFYGYFATVALESDAFVKLAPAS